MAIKKERMREMEVVISGVFTCSSHDCLAEMSLRLATDLPCQSASRCVYHAAFHRMGKSSDRARAHCLEIQLTSASRRYKHHLSVGFTVFGVFLNFIFSLNNDDKNHYIACCFVAAICWSLVVDAAVFPGK